MTSTSAKILLAALGVVSLSSPAIAAGEAVGVTAAVNPDATGQIANEPLRELMVGHDVIRNERIKTASIGQAQLLFTDQSTLTVARNSEIVIDEFVFDPSKQSGNLAATVTTGVFRYVGGKISKQKDVTFYTPNGSVSVRGGIILFKVDGTSRRCCCMASTWNCSPTVIGSARPSSTPASPPSAVVRPRSRCRPASRRSRSCR